jgi:hypothetical protein
LFLLIALFLPIVPFLSIALFLPIVPCLLIVLFLSTVPAALFHSVQAADLLRIFSAHPAAARLPK